MSVCHFSKKSDVPMMVAIMCSVVAIMLVPLLDLGSYQVLNACKFESNIDVYHLEECCCEDSGKLRKRFQSVHDEEWENVTIFFIHVSTGFVKGLYVVKCDKGISREGVHLHLLYLLQGPRIEQ